MGAPLRQGSYRPHQHQCQHLNSQLALSLSVLILGSWTTVVTSRTVLRQTFQRDTIPQQAVDYREKFRDKLRLVDAKKVQGSPMYLGLIFMGSFPGSTCHSKVLTDLLEGLSAIPLTYNSSDRKLPLKDFPNVAQWWTSGPASWGVARQVYHLFTREISWTNALTSKILHNSFQSPYYDRETGQYVTPDAKKLASLKSRTVFIIVLGTPSGNPKSFSPPLLQNAKPSSPQTCGTFALAGGHQNLLKGFYGAVIIPTQLQEDWEKNCLWMPPSKSGVKRYPNNCPVADGVATHVLAKLADFLTTPGLACTVADLKNKGCSGGTACDIRKIKDRPRGPEQSALASATTDIRAVGEGIQSNVQSANYRFFIQPYAKKEPNKAVCSMS